MITVFGNFDEVLEPSTCSLISFSAPFSQQEITYRTCSGKLKMITLDAGTSTRPECIEEISIQAGKETQIINNGPCEV